MGFNNIFRVHKTALDLARSKYHQKIVKLLSHFNQNKFSNLTFRTKIENAIKLFFPNTDASRIELLTNQISIILEEQI